MQRHKFENKRDSDIVYKFPAVATSSVTFEVKGAKVTKATLEVNGAPIASHQPTYDDTWTKDQNTPLDFLGGVPFRAALAKDLKPTVSLACKVISNDYEDHVVSNKNPPVPTLLLKLVEDNLSWDKINPPHIDDVTVATSSGEKKMKLVYLPNRCGYIKE